MSSSFRSVEALVRGVATSDGAGVRLTRVLTQNLQRRLDPFLMLDAFRNNQPEDYMGGFPDHPHRGFETVTYILAGRMRHHDSAGNHGLLGPGGMQWMTAGSGLIHSELPEQEQGLMEGFQLWLNLPAQDKMCAPYYQDIASAGIPEYLTPEGIRVRVLAGESGGVAGAIQRPVTEPLYLDVHLPTGARWVQPLAAQHNAFSYTYRGACHIAGTEVPDQHMAILSNDGSPALCVETEQPSRMLLITGRPLNEPIAQYGPFVMNSQAEIQQAFRDYHAGLFAHAAVQARSSQA